MPLFHPLDSTNQNRPCGVVVAYLLWVKQSCKWSQVRALARPRLLSFLAFPAFFAAVDRWGDPLCCGTRQLWCHPLTPDPVGPHHRGRTEGLTARRVETLSPSFFQKDENVTSHHIFPIHIRRRRLQRLTAAKIHLQPHASLWRVSRCPFSIRASRIHHCKNPRFQIPNPSPYVVRVCECEGAR